MKSFGRIELRNREDRLIEPRSTRADWKWFSAELIRFPKSRFEFRVKAKASYLAIHDIQRRDGETTITGEAYSAQKILRDKITFMPAGHSAEGWSDFTNQKSTVLALHLASPIEEGVDFSAIPPALYFENSILKTSLWKFQTVLENGGLYDAAYAETLALLIAWELQVALASKSPSAYGHGGLTVQQLMRIRELVVARIAEDISVSDLAEIAGLSLFHFTRAFKKSVGVSPYQFVLQERINRAKELMVERDNQLEDIARRVGFRDLVHLNRIFRRFVGVTPAAYRRTGS